MNKIILDLNKKIYECDKIRKTAEAFAGIVDVDILDEGNSYKCVFTNFKLGDEKTVREFENYLINLMNKSEDLN